MSTPTLIDAAKQARNVLEDLNRYYSGEGSRACDSACVALNEAIAAHKSASQEWALKAAEEINMVFRKWAGATCYTRIELAAIIQKHAPAQQVNEGLLNAARHVAYYIEAHGNTNLRGLSAEFVRLVKAAESAPPSLERELAEALRSLVRPYEENAVAVDNHVRNKEHARAVLARFDERNK